MAWSQTSTYETAGGTFTVPGRTTAVFVDYENAGNLIGDLIDQIHDLVDQGVLNRGQGNSLIKKLEGALTKWEKQPQVAINRLNAFINEVNGLANGSTLTQDQAQQLIEEAEIIIAAIEAGM